jgi:DnaJ like chaperone protein
MAAGKWITGVLGWVIGGPIGGIVGFALGSMLDAGVKSSTDSRSGGGTSGERNSFLMSLLVLSSAVMKADGKVMRSELEYVKNFIALNFGPDAVPQCTQILKRLLEQDVLVREVCGQIRMHMNLSARLQLLHYLTGIAQADGVVSALELAVLRAIADALAIPRANSDSIFAMFEKGVDSAYQVLEIDRNASDDDVKQAYRRLAQKHHPDKVASLGTDVQKAAEQKFKAISVAYERIKKERGIT